MDAIIQQVNKKYMKKTIPDIATGDIVRVSKKITEGGKTRNQIFEGVVIARERKNGLNASFTVRKITNGIGVEKKFFLHSPSVEKVKVLRSSKVRRKKIFYLRNLTGKATKLKEKQRKILEEAGLGEDENIETAETTKDLATVSAKEEENKSETKEENKEETEQENEKEVKNEGIIKEDNNAEKQEDNKEEEKVENKTK